MSFTNLTRNGQPLPVNLEQVCYIEPNSNNMGAKLSMSNGKVLIVKEKVEEIVALGMPVEEPAKKPQGRPAKPTTSTTKKDSTSNEA